MHEWRLPGKLLYEWSGIFGRRLTRPFWWLSLLRMVHFIFMHM
jgi:hypothetical protein